MSRVRALFRCSSAKYTKHTSNPNENTLREFEFTAVYDPSVPEEERYSRFTPSGRVTLTVDNPAVDWQPGKAYYVDFTPVDED